MSLMEAAASLLPPLDNRSIAQIDQEILDELGFHIEMRTQANIEAGVPPAEARAAAMRRFGDVERIRATCRKTQLGERIMLQRLQTALTLVLLLAVAAMAYQSYRAQRANEAALADVGQALKALAEQPAGAPGWYADRPVVAEAFPKTGAKEVDPASTEIRVTYNKPMADGSWSWVKNSSETFPQATGDVHYLKDMKTCVMPVKLEPGKKYVIWFNSQNHQNFKDTEGRPAVPYLLTFTTRD